MGKHQLRETISIDDAIDFLNELLEIDRVAVHALVSTRMPCNEEMARHPTVQVAVQNGGFYVGPLGVLNGLFGSDEDFWGPIQMVFEDDPDSNFPRLVRFQRTLRVEAQDETEEPAP